MSLLNGISMGRTGNYRADSGVWGRAARSPRYLRNFVCPKIVDGDDVVALERWREMGRGFRYARPGAIRGAGGDGVARICYCALDELYDSQTLKGASR